MNAPTPMPLVSIVLPTFNRAQFLPGAFASIRAQNYREWELIVVDDGSTDDTSEVVARETGTLQRIQYLQQLNSGPAAARNLGIAHAVGKYVACLDSDDAWSPAYLRTMVEALEATPRVDWLYCACQIEDYASGRVLEPSSFYTDGRPRPFLALRAAIAGRVRVLEDPSWPRTAVSSGLLVGFQNSVMRRESFSSWAEPVVPARVGEDVLTAVRAMASGKSLAYIDEPLVHYRVHDANTVAASMSDMDRVIRNTVEYDKGYSFLIRTLQDQPAVVRELSRARGARWFWTAGYSACWLHGRRAEAFEHFRRGIRCWPWSPAMWKTYILCAARVRFRASGGAGA